MPPIKRCLLHQPKMATQPLSSCSLLPFPTRQPSRVLSSRAVSRLAALCGNYGKQCRGVVQPSQCGDTMPQRFLGICLSSSSNDVRRDARLRASYYGWAGDLGFLTVPTGKRVTRQAILYRRRWADESDVEKLCKEMVSREVWCEKTFVNERRSEGIRLRYEVERREYGYMGCYYGRSGIRRSWF